MMGHSSMAMVDRVYGKLDEATYRRAIAKLPGGTPTTHAVVDPDCHAGVTSPAQSSGKHGTDGTEAMSQPTADCVQSAPRERHADVTISIAYSVDAQRMLDEADERWIAEHGFLVDNPLVAEIQRPRSTRRIAQRRGHGRCHRSLGTSS